MPFGFRSQAVGAREEIGAGARTERGKGGKQRVTSRLVRVEVIARHELEQLIQSRCGTDTRAKIDDRVQAPARRIFDELSSAADGGRTIRHQNADHTTAQSIVLVGILVAYGP